MGNYRDDGSVEPTSFPVWENQFRQFEPALLKGIIVDTNFVDSPESTQEREVTYTVLIVGGDRNGQLIENVRDMDLYGDRFNFSEIVRKPFRSLLFDNDPASPVNIQDVSQINANYVYLAFLNGDPNMPVIIGGATHNKNDEKGAKAADGIMKREYFNGISSKIDKDGIFSWIKAKGQAAPLFPNLKDPLSPMIEEFAPIPGFEEFIKLNIDNEGVIKLENLAGNSLTYDTFLGNFKLEFLTGMNLELDATKELFNFTTATGLNALFDGLKDTISNTTATGVSWELSGTSDKISGKTAAGDSIELSSSSGFVVKTVTGAELNMGATEIKLTNGVATLKLSATGQVAFGSSAAELLDIISQLLQALSTDTYAGFGAPATNVAQYAQLLTKIQLIKGSI